LGFVTVTHPHHPLCGQQVAVVRLRRGANPDLIVRLPDGNHAAIAMSLTDYGGAAAAPAASSAAPALLDLEGLRQAAGLIAQLRQQGRFSTASS
jgi:hypothetical protein